MHAKRVIVTGLVAMAVAAAVGAAISAEAGSGPGRLLGPPGLQEPGVPRLEHDRGAGERLLLVVGGAFPTREAAEAANAEISLGELQGFYVALTDQFVGLDRVLGGATDEYVLVSAFRTGNGARDFLDLVRTAGAPAFVTPRLQNLGFEYVGLGQEADPDGTGPLTEPIPGLTT
jgi:hypothetical protein